MKKPDKEKIRLMTDLSIYEKKNRTGVLEVNSYYRFDYTAGHLFSAFIRYTLCALIIVALYVLVNSGELFYNINLTGTAELLKLAGIRYLQGLAVYLLIALVLYSVRYSRAVKGTLLYAAKLRRLGRRYYYDKKTGSGGK